MPCLTIWSFLVEEYFIVCDFCDDNGNKCREFLHDLNFDGFDCDEFEYDGFNFFWIGIVNVVLEIVMLGNGVIVLVMMIRVKLVIGRITSVKMTVMLGSEVIIMVMMILVMMRLVT